MMDSAPVMVIGGVAIVVLAVMNLVRWVRMRPVATPVVADFATPDDARLALAAVLEDPSWPGRPKVTALPWQQASAGAFRCQVNFGYRIAGTRITSLARWDAQVFPDGALTLTLSEHRPFPPRRQLGEVVGNSPAVGVPALLEARLQQAAGIMHSPLG